jgi:hypothetical protein
MLHAPSQLDLRLGVPSPTTRFDGKATNGIFERADSDQEGRHGGGMSGDDHDKRPALLTARDIAALNKARVVLKRLEDTAWRRSLEHYDPFADVTAWDLGRLSGAASAGEDALFHVLSTARANCRVRMTDDQLRGTERAHEPPSEEGEAPVGDARGPNGVPRAAAVPRRR